MLKKYKSKTAHMGRRGQEGERGNTAQRTIVLGSAGRGGLGTPIS